MSIKKRIDTNSNIHTVAIGFPDKLLIICDKEGLDANSIVAKQNKHDVKAPMKIMKKTDCKSKLRDRKWNLKEVSRFSGMKVLVRIGFIITFVCIAG